jgi:hypothetical protein
LLVSSLVLGALLTSFCSPLRPTVSFDTAPADFVVIAAIFDELFTVVLRTFLKVFSSFFLA